MTTATNCFTRRAHIIAAALTVTLAGTACSSDAPSADAAVVADSALDGPAADLPRGDSRASDGRTKDSAPALDITSRDASQSAPDGGQAGAVISDDPTQPRSWPAKHGDALIALWPRDALASIAVTIDDNTKPDHSWWLSMGTSYQLRFTWFVITGRIGTNPAYFGNWSDFAKLVAAGHDVQSHTVTHLDGSLTIDKEYADSQQAIETNLPGVRALTLAYPGGGNSSLNDESVAAKYYIGARGTVGHDNDAVGMKTIRTNSISGTFNLITEHWAGIPNLIVQNPKHASSYRGFHCIHFHQVKDKTAAETGLKYIDTHRKDLWPGLFREVMQYVRERESATLTVPHVSPNTIWLRLSDTLDDKRFDYPLTIKVALASDWKQASATQAGKSLPVTIVTHGGKPYALVEVTPDRGDVALRRN
jgi:peptidoglycan/xylan/chitin deacetylase (PgdA/CDA1 family)